MTPAPAPPAAVPASHFFAETCLSVLSSSASGAGSNRNASHFFSRWIWNIVWLVFTQPKNLFNSLFLNCKKTEDLLCKQSLVKFDFSKTEEEKILFFLLEKTEDLLCKQNSSKLPAKRHLPSLLSNQSTKVERNLTFA